MLILVVRQREGELCLVEPSREKPSERASARTFASGYDQGGRKSWSGSGDDLRSHSQPSGSSTETGIEFAILHVQRRRLVASKGHILGGEGIGTGNA